MRRGQLLIFLGALCGAVSLPASAQEEIGRTVAAKTSVTGHLAGRTTVLESEDPIFMDERIAASETGLGHFQFRDGTKMVVGPGSSITVDKFVYRSANTLQQVAFQATGGFFRFIGGSSPGPAFSITTPSATIGVRGTAFDYTVQRGMTHVVVTHGSVRLCSGTTCQLLNRPCQYAAAGGGQVSTPRGLGGETDDNELIGNLFPMQADQSELERGFQVATCGREASVPARGGGVAQPAQGPDRSGATAGPGGASAGAGASAGPGGASAGANGGGSASSGAAGAGAGGGGAAAGAGPGGASAGAGH